MHPSPPTALGRAGYPGHAPRRPPVRDRPSSAGSTSWSPSTAATSRRCAASGADPDRLVLLRPFDPAAGAAADVPDPYYGDDGVFDDCRDMIAAACAGLVTSLAATLGLRSGPPEPPRAPASRRERLVRRLTSARTCGEVV